MIALNVNGILCVGVVTTGDFSSGMAKYFDGRIRQLIVLVRRTCLAKILEPPKLLLVCLDVRDPA